MPNLEDLKEDLNYVEESLLNLSALCHAKKYVNRTDFIKESIEKADQAVSDGEFSKAAAFYSNARSSILSLINADLLNEQIVRETTGNFFETLIDLAQENKNNSK